ncbi:MAG: cysteine--tRNA ligase [Candidatus Micrarchaeota archaeon]
MLNLFNSLSLKKEEFKPLKGKSVGFYACGPTVYDHAHIGNFRAYLSADLLRKWLEHEGFEVKQVMNLTDVDDKTIKNSREQGKTLKEFTSFFSKAFFEDLDSLGIKRASVYPKATEHVREMISIIEKLLENGFAYRGEDGSVYYKISKFKNYGKLSHLNLKELKVGASGRLTADEYEKESVSDFALWKAWTPDDGEVFWNAPFGKGRPGWHIECSAMSMKYLGESFDIHAGGVDLKFPHHENEIAQSEGATGKPFVKYWLHNEHLLVDGRKMAKRFKNFYTLRDILAKGYSPKAIRFLLLSTHYRSQLNFTFEALENAENTVKKLGEFAFRLKNAASPNGDSKLDSLLEKTKKDFENAMNDDLDVSSALAVVFAFVKDFNKAVDENRLSKKTAGAALAFLKDFDGVFGVVDWAASEKTELSSEVERLVEEREAARKEKNFKRADEIRNLLKKKGILLEDSPKGVVWKKA